jgi:hypothetical protein
MDRRAHVVTPQSYEPRHPDRPHARVQAGALECTWSRVRATACPVRSLRRRDARGAIEDVIVQSVLPAFPSEEREEDRLIDELARRVDATADELRIAIGVASQDPVTQALYIDIARSIEAQRWMLLAHLPVAGREAP